MRAEFPAWSELVSRDLHWLTSTVRETLTAIKLNNRETECPSVLYESGTQKCRTRRYKYLATSTRWCVKLSHADRQVGFGFSFTFTTDASFAALSAISANVAPTA